MASMNGSFAASMRKSLMYSDPPPQLACISTPAFSSESPFPMYDLRRHSAQPSVQPLSGTLTLGLTQLDHSAASRSQCHVTGLKVSILPFSHLLGRSLIPSSLYSSTKSTSIPLKRSNASGDLQPTQPTLSSFSAPLSFRTFAPSTSTHEAGRRGSQSSL